MKKVYFWVVAWAISIITTGCFGIGTISADAQSRLADERYSFEYLVSRIEFLSGGEVALTFENNNNTTSNDNEGIVLWTYRTLTVYDPFEIITPVPLIEEISTDGELFVKAQVGVFADAPVRVLMADGLGSSDDFYFSVAVWPKSGGDGTWIGTRIVSFRSCLEDARHIPDDKIVVCELRGETGGTFYYDAYVDGILAREIEPTIVGRVGDALGDQGEEENGIKEMVKDGKGSFDEGESVAESVVIDEAGVAAVAEEIKEQFIGAADGVSTGFWGGGFGLAPLLLAAPALVASRGGFREMGWVMILWMVAAAFVIWFIAFWKKRRKERGEERKNRSIFEKYAKMGVWKG